MSASSETAHAVSVAWGGATFSFSHTDPQDHIFRVLRETGGFYEPELLGALQGLLAPGDVVVDVGANIGNHTVFFAGVCGCSVIAVEPAPAALDLLRQNVASNGLEDKVTIVAQALASEKGHGRIVAPDNTHNLGLNSVELGDGDVDVSTLDDLCRDISPKLIKIDVEGMELAVLRGGRGVIEEHKPAVCAEAGSIPEFESLLNFLAPDGYLAADVYNFTPTHIFRAFADDVDLRSLLTSYSRSIGRLHIKMEDMRNRLGQRIAALERKS